MSESSPEAPLHKRQARRMIKRAGLLGSLATLLLISTSAQSAEPLSIHINVTTDNRAWAPRFERCIQRGIAARVGDVSLVAFTPYERSAVDIYVVTQPALTQGGEQWGIAAAVVADVRESGLPPQIVAVTSGANRSGMAYICRSAVELFYSKIQSEVRRSRALSNPQPFDAWEAEFDGFR